ncbi:type VI secretion system tube protein Hcp [Chimaeribacter californicus]|uniref:Type VI secretion system tube protein Hcp n=1 Tax=Chimaeribacter californicus TaxID=2060067 RepID=A0A2N5E8B8_9GAMM|nr:type VI secretion system tube protein TssD [Chimaeribacter californicus]PLR37913.1 type VI secretion system tube protein Hcp [Chimaeribacter californicus]
MAIPVYMYLKDDANNLIKGGVDIYGRENSVEVLGFHHSVDMPTDDHTGRISGKCKHLPFLIEKEIDCATPYLYKAMTSGQTLNSVELKHYRINDAGQEEEYYTVLLEKAKVVNVFPIMHDIKDVTKEKFNHLELVEFRYEKITWHYLDGNIIHSNSWLERA